MSIAVALVLGVGIFLVVHGARGAALVDRVGRYLRPSITVAPLAVDPVDRSPAADAGLGWSRAEYVVRRSATAAAGALVGILLAQGDLFVEGPGRSMLPMAALGAAAGWLGLGMWISTRKEQRARRLRFELPVVTDALALHVLAGESVATALQRYARDSTGVAADEIRVTLAEITAGRGVSEALQRSTHRTADPEAARLYTLLAHAHDTGGRLADALGDLGSDYRAALARDLTAEGGRRALTTYGPVLALMVPVTLLFLLYPTLVGLRSLAGDP
ncbi:MAG: type II secretion system F family protein [Actinomycetota bacterium]